MLFHLWSQNYLLLIAVANHNDTIAGAVDDQSGAIDVAGSVLEHGPPHAQARLRRTFHVCATSLLTSSLDMTVNPATQATEDAGGCGTPQGGEEASSGAEDGAEDGAGGEASTLELKEYLQRTLRPEATMPSPNQLAKRMEAPPATQVRATDVAASLPAHQRGGHRPRLRWRAVTPAGEHP